MNFNEFVNEVKDNIKLFLTKDYENAEVSTMECHKLNRAYSGLMVRKEGEMLTPTINLNQLYEALLVGPESRYQSTWIRKWKESGDRICEG